MNSIQWLKYTPLYFVLSSIILIAGIFSLATHGLRLGIDFSGGTLWEVQFDQPVSFDLEKMRASSGDSFSVVSVQSSGENRYIIRGIELSADAKNQIMTALTEQVGSFQERRFEQVGPTISKELLFKTLMAVGIVSAIITLYVWRQFHEFRYGLSAVLAMFHDSFVLLGSFSLLGWFMGVEVDVLFVTAMLTTLSFSVHDTIVVFDRIRELRRKHPTRDFTELANTAVTETLSRSLNNSITIILVLLSLVLFGGESIAWFAVALLIGAVTGTYSSTFVAVPLLAVWEKKRVIG